MHAKATRATLTIFVPYSAELQKQVDAQRELVADLRKRHPTLAIAELFDIPAVSEFSYALPWDEIRVEFARKAKKLDLSFRESPFPVSMTTQSGGLMLEVTAIGKQ